MFRMAWRVVLAGLFVVVVGGVVVPVVCALPVGRVYEMVSPLYKGGFGVGELKAVAPGGGSVAFYSVGVFAGAPTGSSEPGYLAFRDGGGWHTESLLPPTGMAPQINTYDFSSSLGGVSLEATPGGNLGGARIEGVEQDFLFHDVTTADTEADWELVANVTTVPQAPGFATTYIGASNDLCHVIVFNSRPLLPGSEDEQGQLYDVVSPRCDGGVSVVRPVGLNDQGGDIRSGPEGVGNLCDIEVAGTSNTNRYFAIADGGSEVFFSSCVGSVSDYGRQLFVRLGGARTIEVSRPVELECSEVPCVGAGSRPSAQFEGASEDGSVVFFSTRAQLVGEDVDSGNDLYMARIGCPEALGECEVAQREVVSLTRVSHSIVSGGEAGVLGVVRVSPDGSRVYFVAEGVLTQEADAEGAVPVKGADNLYVYDGRTGQVSFITDLCSDAEHSGGSDSGVGGVGDSRCPADLVPGNNARNDTVLWRLNEGEVQTAGGDGRFLLFSSYGRLTADDFDNGRDVFEYDAVNKALVRVSVGEAGADANGNGEGYDASIVPAVRGGRDYNQYGLNSRSVSDDGSRVVFMTSEPLSSRAANGLGNVYEWHAGSVSIVSSGDAVESDKSPLISSSGEDVFFLTDDGLVPGDTDGAFDVYDARLGGVSPRPLAEPRSCVGEVCQGPASPLVPVIVPGSVSGALGENIVADSRVGAPKKKSAKKPRRRRRGRHGGVRHGRRGVRGKGRVR